MSYPDASILEIAKAQRAVIWCLLSNAVCIFLPILFFVVVPIEMYWVYRLAAALNAGSPILWAIGMIVPMLNLVLLLILSLKAGTAIQRAGFSVGFFGARIKEIEERMGI